MTADLRKFAWLSIATSIATIVLKFGAFWLSNSVSLLSDAIESLVNLAAGLVALWALWLSGLPADETHAYGHNKAEYFSSGAEGVLILAAAAAIIWSAVERFFHPAVLAELGWGLGVSFIASGCNLVTARILLAVGKRRDSITLEADARHLMTDVWTSVGIGAGLLLVLWSPGLAWLDPTLAIVVGLNIVVTAYKLLRRSADGLMDAALPAAEVAELRILIAQPLAGSGKVLDLRTRKSGAQRFVEVTVGLPAAMSVGASHRLCDEIEAAIHRRYAPPPKVVVHVEPLA
jgi:cation diffusion facilitator family transporter